MTDKNEWKAAHDELLADARTRTGEPPAFDEVLALMNGQLPEQEAQRVRERLLAYPELMQIMVASAPEGTARPGDDDFIPDAEMSRRWAALQKRTVGKAPVVRSVINWRRAALGLAAALVLAMGGLLAEASSYARLKHELREPHVLGEEQLLTPDRHRGGSDVATIAAADGEWYVLSVSLIDATANAFRLTIVDAGTGSMLWRSPPLRRRESDTFTIQVPRALLRAGGKYQVIVYAGEGAAEERLETYTFVATGR
jgi:hypothetical protein